ncbi:MAG: magnesium/cobalt transporter CorA [candidate division WOR-3 bacterium]|nr:MAG: magnesium/cobalt transporter CorA [candidate division WOR-3 bacterium]
MARYGKRKAKKAGLPPGTLVHVGEKKTEKIRIRVLDYTEGTFEEKDITKVEDCYPFKEKSTVTWINVDGIHDVDIIEKIGENYGVHPLLLEDILNTEQRPKIEDFEDYIFLVLKMLAFDEKEHEVKIEQVSFVIGPNYVISFQEKEGDVFDPVRERIRNAKGRIRRMGADYLAYALLDAIVDSYFFILEKIGDKIEGLEEDLIANPDAKTLQTIHYLKREMIFLRRSVWPLREVISGMSRKESALIKESTEIFLRDVYDHTIQVIDTIENFRDMVSGMLDIYLSSLSNRMNEVMKVLTIFAAIFIPLTFVAGIYGMNFAYMPELGWKWGYFGALAVMAGIGITMLVYFKKKHWL